MTTKANVWRFLVHHIIDFEQKLLRKQYFFQQMTARAVIISRVTASGSGMCGVLGFVLFFFFHLFCASDCGSWRFSKIILPALTETLFFSSIDSFFLLFPFLLRTNGWNFVSSNYHMTWSAFALFLTRRTEFPFNIGHFWIILPFHSLLATFQVSISLIFDLFWGRCFGWNKSKVM